MPHGAEGSCSLLSNTTETSLRHLDTRSRNGLERDPRQSLPLKDDSASISPPHFGTTISVAGRERRFNRCHNRLLDPEAWSLNKQRLVFMEENQGVAWWGVSVRNPKSDDPAVHQGMNYDDSIAWCPEHRKCSVFLAVMLHYHAVDGGFRFCGMADAPEETDYRFEKHGWTFYGEVKSLQAYSRPHQVVCLLPPGNLPFAERWSVMAAAKSKRELAAIAEEIGLTFS